MNTLDFLTRVWPDDGPYVLATPFKIPNTDKVTYRHKVCDTITDAVKFVTANRLGADLFFAVHSLKERRVWNPDKVDYKTGEKGAYQVRVQRNMRAARCFFFDLDVGEATPRTPKYASQADAQQDLIRFCEAAQLPQPLVTSSGGGLHVYWLLTDELPSDEWKTYAQKLRELANHHGLKADPARTTDAASVLRVVGTFNLKNPEEPRKVRVTDEGVVTPTSDFLAALDNAAIRADVTVADVPDQPTDEVEEIFGSNLGGPDDLPKTQVKWRALYKTCAQVRRIADLRGNVSEPEWYAALGLMPYVKNGVTKIAHLLSEGHPDYSAEATEAKLAQVSTLTGPTTCAKLGEVCGSSICEKCEHWGKIKSPVVAARYNDIAPAPVVSVSLGDDDDPIDLEIPQPPAPFARLDDGKGVVMKVTNADGEDVKIVIYEHDLYPLRRISNRTDMVEQQVWRVVLPREGAVDFEMAADALYDTRKFVVTLANVGMYPAPGNVKNLQEYMVAYIAHLQKMADAEAQCTHLGWTKSLDEFVLPDKIITTSGEVKPASLSLAASRSAATVTKKGTLDRQIELLKFYDHPAYIPNQFEIMCGIGTPLFHYTGHAGVIVNASGDAGASKSTTLYTVASLWGDTNLYPISGTNTGSSQKGRLARLNTVGNLPVCVDEITHIPISEARDLAMSVTQPGNRVLLEKSGIERAIPDQRKSTVMFTTANSSLHNLLSSDNAAGTAGSMRVVEMRFRAQMVHQKFEADDYLQALTENFGHMGERFMMKVVKMLPEAQRAVRAKMREIDGQAFIQSGERFWSSLPAMGLVAGEIAKAQGLLVYDPGPIQQWYVKEQIAYMRGVVTEEYSSPKGILADFLDKFSSNIVVTGEMHAGPVGRYSHVIAAPRGELAGHYDKMSNLLWVSKTAFKNYCVSIGANSSQILTDLHVSGVDRSGDVRRIVLQTNIKKTLGAFTDFAKAQTRCFTIDMSHPEIAGAVDLGGADNTKLKTAPAQGPNGTTR